MKQSTHQYKLEVMDEMFSGWIEKNTSKLGGSALQILDERSIMQLHLE